MTNTTPEVPAELLDQVLAGWSLHLAANGGTLNQIKAAEIAIREVLAYADEQATEFVTINGEQFQIVDWIDQGADPGAEGVQVWALYARPIASGSPTEEG